MSTISLYHKPPVARTKSELKLTKSTSSDNYRAIIGVTSLFFGVALLFTLLIPIMTTPEGLTMDDMSSCMQKIIGFQRLGYYSSQEQFRLAISYCHTD